ncbi:MAG: glycoside hydrolase family 3 N-terminal domain-containing protein [Actinomycetota bacterium]
MQRAARAIAAAVCLALVATGCGLTDGQAQVAAPTPEVDGPVLLPPTADAEGTTGSSDDQAGSADDAAVSTDAEPIELEEPPTPTPVPLNLDCLQRRERYTQLLLPLAVPDDLSIAAQMAADRQLGGIALLGFPDESLPDRLTEIQQNSFVPVMIASDEEGGSVQRLSNVLGPLPSAAESARISSPQDVREQWVEYGARAKALGIDVILGPVVDVGGAPGIGSRSFGDEPVVVTAYGRAVTEGLLEAGVMPVLKHFPGHGRASGDSHLGLPVVPSIDELRTSDLVPYVEIVGDHKRDEAGVMIGHLTVPGLSEDLPTSLSPETVNGLLRNEIGFGGLVFTDAMNMGAIVERFGPLEALGLALEAGSDIVILGSLNDVAPALDYLVARADEDVAFAALLERNVWRVLEAKGQMEICAGASG